MCGIVGVVALGNVPLPNRDLIARMNQTLIHRGPDDEGSYVDHRVGMGMRRLSIIDIAGGHQPVSNEDGSVRVVFNGEIYNYRELRTELQRAGHKFRTNSDTEVIAHGYEEYGLDFPKRLNGMFAIAVYDSAAQKLVLVRDHVGIKPLYYAQSNGYLIWGSEIKALLASGLVERSLDTDALLQFMAWEYVPAPQTLLDGVAKLQPGCLLEIDLNRSSVVESRFWDVPLNLEKPLLSKQEWREAIDEKLKECVRRQLVSDVPLGAFLSGGVDSSLIVAAMGDAQTFSIGFDDTSYNELQYSCMVAEHLGVEHVTEVIESQVVDLFDHLMTFMDDPIGDFSIFPTYLVSKLARNHVTVALSGDGGDELFGGYDTYVADHQARYYQMIPGALRQTFIEPIINRIQPGPKKKGLVNKLKRFVEGTTHSDSLGHARWRLLLDEYQRSNLMAYRTGERDTERHIKRLFDAALGASQIDQSLYVDIKSYLSDNILPKVDRMSMAVSLETRVPFLDPELIEMAFKVPDSQKVRGTRTKVLLKEVAATHVPRSCVYRQKEGFSIPIKNWLGTQFRPLLNELLDKKRIERAGIFQASEVERLKREHLAGVANHSHIIWNMMVFEAWRERWLESALPPAAVDSRVQGTQIVR